MDMEQDPRPGVIIYPLGPVEHHILCHLAATVHQSCQLSCTVDEQLQNPSYAYDPVRDQYCCRRILQWLERRCSPRAWRVLAVTEADLFVLVFKYVFGAARMEGRCAVISLHRLRPQFYGEKENVPLLLARVTKTALHELGHSIGLTHCRRRTCVMYSSTKIRDTDAKTGEFCPTCRELFRWYFERGQGRAR
jgi:archaemetzincin